MMPWIFWVASLVFSGFLVMGGLLRFVLSIREKSNLLPISDVLPDKERFRALAVGNVILGGVGLLFLFSATEDPLDILIGLAIVSLLWEVALRRGSVNWTR